MLTLTKKVNDSTTMKRTKMAKWLNYYGMEGVDFKDKQALFSVNMIATLAVSYSSCIPMSKEFWENHQLQ